MKDTKVDMYECLITDAERRIGSYIVQGGDSNDPYVRQQVAKIVKWSNKVCALLGIDIYTNSATKRKEVD